MLFDVKKFLTGALGALMILGVADNADAAKRHSKDDISVSDTKPAKEQVNDPLEPFNRAVFDFNQVADKYVLRPVAMGYRYITPQVVRTHIGNVADNLYEPLNTVNALLQGDIQQGVASFFRFAINSTIGLAGINDVATEAGLPQRTEDFGQTLAVWGVGSGPYLMLPILGPSNFRDTGGRIGDWLVDPVNYYVDTTTSIGIAVGEGIVTREQLIETIDDINSSSLDPYVSYRSIYAQRRQAQIENRYSGSSVDTVRP